MGWNNSDVGEKRPVAVPKARGLRRLLVAAAVLAAVAFAAWWNLHLREPASLASGSDGDKASRIEDAGKKRRLKSDKKQRMSAKEAVRGAMPKKLSRNVKKHVGDRPRYAAEMFDHLTEEDRKMAKAVQEALDSDDFQKTIAAATEALTSTNVEVRMNAVDALGWYGAQALPELTGAMADEDEDIRQAAGGHFDLALQGLEKPEDQFNVAMAAFGTLTDEDQLVSLGGIINSAATELIDGEENEQKQSANRVAVVQALVDIIEGGANVINVSAAKEAYNDITGNEWRSTDEAERYLCDPENYDPDEAPAEKKEADPVSDASQAE